MNAKIGNPIVLDAQVIMAFLQNERGADRVEEILNVGEPWMTLVNLGEVVYTIERVRGSSVADEVYAELLMQNHPSGRQPIRLVPIDEALVRQAASFKARGGMSYADCFVAAAAARLDCPVLTGDKEFVAAERAGIAVEWI